MITNSEFLADIKDRVQKKTVHELRQLARKVGVAHPTDKPKDEVIEEILLIATCKLAPAPRALRGAPPKSEEFDKQLVADIEECMIRYTAENSEDVGDNPADYTCSGVFAPTDRASTLRVSGVLPSAEDVSVHDSFVHRFRLREGDYIIGVARRKGAGEQPALINITGINGFPPSDSPRRTFDKLTALYPQTRLRMEFSGCSAALRAAELFCPIGKGQRCVLSAPSNSGKTTFLTEIGKGISLNQPDIRTVVLITAGRPEDITFVRRTLINAEVYGTHFGQDMSDHCECAKMVIARCRRGVESGEHILLIADGLGEFAVQNGQHRLAKDLFATAINAEEGGSVTVIGTLPAQSSPLVTEVSAGANMYLKINKSEGEDFFPAIDILSSYTSRCESLQSEAERAAAGNLRALARITNDAASVAEKFVSTKCNAEILKDF